jgi:hypothetical protein
MRYKWFLKKSIFMEIFDFFHMPLKKITPNFKCLPINDYLSGQSDRWCILKIIILPIRKNRNKFFFVKKVGGVWGVCKCRGGCVTMFSSILYVNGSRQEINPSLFSDSERWLVDLQNEILTNIGRWVDQKLEGGACFS